jgi:hypothetical protein
LEKVRSIRRKLERRGHHPLRFFLKCLEDDDAHLPDSYARKSKRAKVDLRVGFRSSVSAAALRPSSALISFLSFAADSVTIQT